MLRRNNMGFEEIYDNLIKHAVIIEADDDGEPEIIHYPSINFYGCSFNFANDGCSESRFYGGDDIYNPRKEV